MAVWEEKRLGEVAEINPNIKLIKNTLYPHIDINQINSLYRYVYSHAEQFYTGQSCSKYCNKDIVFSRITPCLENRKIAQVKIADELGIGSTEFIIFRGKDEYINQSYLYYLLISDNVVLPAINSMSGASGRQRADRNFIKNIKIKIPDLDTQEKIADILSTYDDLIENNNRRIEILEQMAQEIYKEWFVRFRFPEHEKVKFINGLPEGWEVKKIKDIGKIITGKTPSTEVSDNYGNDIMFIKTPDMHNRLYIINTQECLSIKGHLTQEKKLIPANSILISCIGTAGIVSINAVESHTNQQINSIVIQDIRILLWLFFHCRFLKETIELYGATGATMTNLSKGKLENIKILVPKYDLIYLFDEKINVIFKQIKNLLYNNQNLIKQRDLLLPRLMSGKLEV